MSLPPLNTTTGYTRILTDLRGTMTDLQRQLGTGEKSTTYGGLGTERLTSLFVNERRSEISSFSQTIDLVSLRIDLVVGTLDRINDIAGDTRGEVVAAQFNLTGTDQTSEQRIAYARLEEAIALMRTEADDRYLFSGNALDVPPVEDFTTILDGTAGQAGLKTLIAERKAADAGLDGRGRLALSSTATTLTLDEDGTHPFGFKINAIASTITNVTPAGPAGAPPSASLTFAADNAAIGDTVRVGLTLPDGTTSEITLTATDQTPPGTDEFEIGATVADTINNIETALGAAIEYRGRTELSPASALVASEAFFAGSPGSPPQRVSGAPPETATALVAGTAANTVIWYQGDDSAGAARDTARARVDEGIEVRYGLRANEAAFQRLFASMAVYATETFTDTAEEKVRFRELSDRIIPKLNDQPGLQSVNQIRAEIGVGQQIANDANERHLADTAMLDNLRERVEGVDVNAVATELLTVQTRLDASYRATAIVADMSLVKYL